MHHLSGRLVVGSPKRYDNNQSLASAFCFPGRTAAFALVVRGLERDATPPPEKRERNQLINYPGGCGRVG